MLEGLRHARRVLIVDDHPSFRRCARALLMAEGFEVVGEAADGTTALDLALALDPEFVLLDIQLPDIDGFEVAARLRERKPDLAIVLVSSRDRSDYGSRIEENGVLGFVSKDELSGAALVSLLE
ncbi:MAG TPA: response regulator transcription factor [Gaiellaceae bacterium]